MLRDFVGIFQMQQENEEFWEKDDFSPYFLVDHIKGDFYKIGRITQQPILRTYFIKNNLLYYGNDKTSKTVKAYCDISFTYIAFSIQQQQYWTHIQKGRQSLQIYTQNLEIHNKFKQALTRCCIQTTFAQDYKLIKPIGQGSFSEVSLAFQQSPPYNQYAVKIFKKSSLKNSIKLRFSIANEAQNLLSVNHHNILELFQIHEGPTEVYLITSYASGGQLLKRFSEIKQLPLSKVKHLIINILTAVACLHENGIMHRDIKPPNIIYKNQETETEIILIDLGLSTAIKSLSNTFVRCGSHGYVAPEILRHQQGKKLYNEKCDIYSLGVTIFLILYGYHPFKGPNAKETYQLNSVGKVVFPRNELIGEAGEEFVRQMVQVDPRDRISAQQALEHVFLEPSLHDDAIILLPDQNLSKQQLTEKMALIRSEFSMSPSHVNSEDIIKEESQNEKKNSSQKSHVFVEKQNQQAQNYYSRQNINLSQSGKSIKETNESKDQELKRFSIYSNCRMTMIKEGEKIVQQQQQSQISKPDTVLEDSYYDSDEDQATPVPFINIHQSNSPFEKYRTEKSFQ